MRQLLISILLVLSILRSTAQEGPEVAISITSPDAATTFAFGTVKERSLIWDGKNRQLIARIVFADEDRDGSQTDLDAHEFRFPGVTLDAAKGVFYATSAKGEVIPVAHFRHQLFLKVIETLPNAVVRIQHPRGHVNVVLEALRPDDPALHAPADAPAASPDNGHTVELPSLIH